MSTVLSPRHRHDAAASMVPLGPWLERAEAVGIRFIPAEFSPTFPFQEIHNVLEAFEGLAATTDCAAMTAAFDWVDTRLRAGAKTGEKLMVRWECCASDELKFAASQGKPFGTGTIFHRDRNAYQWFSPDDPRLHECHIGETARLCVRPWIEPKRIDGYPVEFRVFFGERAIFGGLYLGFLGISSYYPQRPLPDTIEIRALAHHIVNQCANPMWMEVRCQYPDTIGCSMDFLVGKDDRVWFLEGGPPHWKSHPSAHPCCFPPFEIDGLALAPLEDALDGTDARE